MPTAPVLAIAIPNPLFEGAINMYVIAGDPLTLVDTGIGTPEALAAVEQGLHALGLVVESVRRIVLTHKHADHIGLARKIHDRSGAQVLVHEDDWDGVADLDRRHADYIPLVRERLQAFGVPAGEIEDLTKMLQGGRRWAEQTPAERLVDGQRLPMAGGELEVIHTPGHTQGSICLRYERYLFSGDHVLPGITPNVGAGELRRSGMLRRYLDSLQRVRRLGDGLEVLPGHGEPFTNLSERAAAIAVHHERREAAILEILADREPKSVYQIARGLFGKLPGFHVALGTAEVHAHLEKSLEDGTVRRDEDRFRRAP